MDRLRRLRLHSREQPSLDETGAPYRPQALLSKLTPRHSPCDQTTGPACPHVFPGSMINSRCKALTYVPVRRPQQLLEATYDEDATELFARLDRATTEGVVTPTPTRTAFLTIIRPQRRPTFIKRAGCNESDADSRPSSRSSTYSTLETTLSTATSERLASTTASSVDSVF